MVFRILLFAYRRPDLTPSEFKDIYETTHMSLLKRLTGPDFPLSHTRRYIDRPPAEEAQTDTAAHNAKFPASVLVGNQADIDYDAMAELTFTDRAAFQTFYAKVSEPEAAEELKREEERFLVPDRLRAVVLEDVTETTRE